MSIIKQIGVTTNLPLFQGIMMNTGQFTTPFTDMIMPRFKAISDTSFYTSVTTDLGKPEQPDISEEKSLEIMAPSVYAFAQETNYAQIFKYKTEVSYLREMTTDNVQGVVSINDPQVTPNGLAQQIALKSQKMKKDMEYTFLRGIGGDSLGNRRTQGISSVIKTNKIDLTGSDLTLENISDGLQKIYDLGMDISGKVKLFVSPKIQREITKLCITTPGYSQPQSRTEAGYNITTIITDFGSVDVIMCSSEFMPDNEILGINTEICRPVYVPIAKARAQMPKILATDDALAVFQTPSEGSGNAIFFSVLGLDHGIEKAHFKISNIGTTTKGTKK